MGYVEELRKIVGHRPLILVGAVVLVINEHGYVLLQQRTEPYGKWGCQAGSWSLVNHQKKQLAVKYTKRRNRSEEPTINQCVFWSELFYKISKR